MRDFEESAVGAGAREVGQKVVKEKAMKGGVKESGKQETMLLSAEELNRKGGKNTATEKASQEPRSSTVTDGEAG